MRAEGDITKEKFRELNYELEKQLSAAQAERDKMLSPGDIDKGLKLDLVAIEKVLNEFIDISQAKLSETLIEKFVDQVTPINNSKFCWTLNFTPNKPQQVYCGIEGRKNKATVSMDEDECPPLTYSHLTLVNSDGTVNKKNTVEGYALHRLLLKVGRSSLYWGFTITFEQAEAYRKATGSYLRKNQWEDISVEIHI